MADNKYSTHGLLLSSKKSFTVLVHRKLKEMPYAQAGILDLHFTGGPYTVLRSFDVDAAWIDENNALTVTQSYSMSSVVRKHVRAFIRQICMERDLRVPPVNRVGKIAGRDRVLFLRSGLILDRYNGFERSDDE